MGFGMGIWDGWDEWDGISYRGHRYSKSTSGANNDISGPQSHREQMTE